MKASNEISSALPSSRTQKLDRTQRFAKQLSQSSVNFVTAKNASTKSIVRISENSLSQKPKSIVTAVTTRGQSIPKIKEREFGREITTNNAMAAVSQ